MIMRIGSLVLGVVLVMGGNIQADDDDDDFDKRYKNQRKRYEERRKEDWKRHQEQRREWDKRQEEANKRREASLRDDRKRQAEALRDWDDRRRDDYRRTLREQIRDNVSDRDRQGISRWWSPPTQAVSRPGVVGQYLPQLVAEISPNLAATLQHAGQNQHTYGPNFRQYALDLSQRGQRLTELARQGRDVSELRAEFPAFDADWQRVMQPLRQAAMHNEEARVVAWQVYQSGRQLRQAIGFDRSQNPDWAGAAAAANELTKVMAHVDATLQRDFAGAPDAQQLLYEVRNAWSEAVGVADLIPKRAQAKQIREQHGYFVVAFEQVVHRLRERQADEHYRELTQQVGRIDRQLCDALGVPEAVTGDLSRVLVEHAEQLSVTADRLRKLLREGLGENDAQVTAYYIQPADHFAYQCELVAQAMIEGRDPYVVRGGWAMIEQLAPQMIQRVHLLDATHFGQIHELASECAALMAQMRPIFGH